MKPTTKNKANRMTAIQERKLAELLPAIFVRVGLDQLVTPSSGTWTARSRVFAAAVVTVTPYVPNDGHPWLACRFDRLPPRPDLPWDAKENRERYRDIREALGDSNPYSGKYNCHIHERLTADQAAERFEAHLRRMLG